MWKNDLERINYISLALSDKKPEEMNFDEMCKVITVLREQLAKAMLASIVEDDDW